MRGADAIVAADLFPEAISEPPEKKDEIASLVAQDFLAADVRET